MVERRVNFCDCKEDGFCPRYHRDMGGRLREICAGVNVDLGTAAAFRHQWMQEVPHAPYRSEPVPLVQPATTEPHRLLLQTHQAPGDAVAMTAAIYSLHRAYPGHYETRVESYWPEVFRFNPDVAAHADVGVPLPPDAQPVQMHYPAIHRSNDRAIHFMQGWCEFLGEALGVPLPLLTNRPRLYFPDPAPPTGDYWVVCSGGKRDFTNKLWGHHNYQEVVDRLRGRVRFIQVGGGRPPVPWTAECHGTNEDEHPQLRGAVDMVGKTTLRDLFDVVRRARGVLCGVSLMMHVAAALEKPAIVIAGGREPVAWNAYPRQQYVHTVGALPCRDIQGHAGHACWRSRVVPLGIGAPVLDADTCERPVDVPGGTIPACMRLITPATVAELVARYEGAA